MRRTRAAREHDRIETSIRTAGSIGALERLAGVGQSDDERYAFWHPFMRLPARESLDAGVAELKRLTRATVGAPRP